MPRICEFYGIVVYMYFGDHNPPHIHAIYGSDEALVTIEDCRVLRGGLPRTAARLVDEWVALHREDLATNWERAQKPEPLVAIAPLR